MTFTQTEKENPMLNDNYWANMERLEKDTDRKDTRTVCPICEGHKFIDNPICYSCKTEIRKDFLKLWDNWHNKQEVIDEVEQLIDVLWEERRRKWTI